MLGLTVKSKYFCVWLALMCAIGDSFLSTTSSSSSSSSSFTFSSSSAAAFRSCTIPRFDEFAECIVGSWYNILTPNMERHDGVVHVEEVMRSCGGAVQGVREIILNDNNENDNDKKQEGQYLNRAFDGFLPYYDGSYTWGPTRLSEIDENNPNQFMTSIFLGEKKLGVRVLMTSDCNTRILSRQEDNSPIYSIKKFPTVMDKKLNITWTNHVRCRMPSVSMSWMAQRLQWEDHHLAYMTNSNENKMNSAEKSLLSSNTTSFFYLCPPTMLSIRQLEQDWSFLTSGDNSCWVENTTNTTAPDELDIAKVCFSALAHQNIVRDTSREYASSNGQLVNVVWSQGTMTVVNDDACIN